MYNQLNNEFILTYTSTGAPGPSFSDGEVSYRNQTDSLQNPLTCLNCPRRLSLISPAEGETLEGAATLNAGILTQGAEVASVEFAANGVIIGKDISAPYEFEWDLTGETPGEVLLEVVAIGVNGEELSRDSLNVYISEYSLTSEPEDSDQDSTEEEPEVLSTEGEEQELKKAAT